MKKIVLISILLLLVSCAAPKYPTIWAHNPKFTADLVGLRNIMVDLPANSKIAVLDVPAESKEIMETMLEKAGFKVVKKAGAQAPAPQAQAQAPAPAPQVSNASDTASSVPDTLSEKNHDANIAPKKESNVSESSNASDPISIGKSLGADVVIVGKVELEKSAGSRLTLRALRVADGELISLSRIYANEFFLKSKENAPEFLGFIDSRDGRVYNVNKIGNLFWMSQNLNYEVGESKCYDNDAKNCINYYGRLYKWDDAQNICPNGWRLPSAKEWTEMVDYASKKDPNVSFVVDYDIYGKYSFWTSSETSKSKASAVYLPRVWVKDANREASVSYDKESKSSYLSVRCVK